MGKGDHAQSLTLVHRYVVSELFVDFGLSRQRAFHASSPRPAPKDPYQVLGVKKDETEEEERPSIATQIQQVRRKPRSSDGGDS